MSEKTHDQLVYDMAFFKKESEWWTDDVAPKAKEAHDASHVINEQYLLWDSWPAIDQAAKEQVKIINDAMTKLNAMLLAEAEPTALEIGRQLTAAGKAYLAREEHNVALAKQIDTEAAQLEAKEG